MSLFDTLGQQPMLQQLKANPAQILKQRGLSIPEGMTDPQQIINHLIQSKQVGGQQLRMLQTFQNFIRR